MSDLLCPKCQAPMRSYERSGVIVDRCTECGGLFLDRGELEHLIAHEGGATTAREPAPAAIRDHDRHDGDDRHDSDDRHDEGERGDGRRRKGGFFSNLLDLGGGD